MIELDNEQRYRAEVYELGYSVFNNKLHPLEMAVQIERLYRSATWFSMEERSPPRGRHLVYFPKQSTSPMDGLWDGKDWTVDGINRTKAVTHWMPMPAAPSQRFGSGAGITE